MLLSLASQATSEAQAQQLAEQSISIAKRAQDAQKVEGEAAVSLIEGAAGIQQAPPTGDQTGQYVNVRV